MRITSNYIFAVIAVTILVFQPFDRAIAQDKKPTRGEKTQAEFWVNEDGELPEHAVSRYGQFGARTDFNGFYSLRFSNDGTHLIARDRKHRLTVLNVATKEVVCNILDLDFVADFDLSYDNEYLITAQDRHGKSKIWKADSGELIKETDIFASSCRFVGEKNEAAFLGEINVHRFSLPKGELVSEKVWRVSEYSDRLREYPVAISDKADWVISCERSGGDKGRLAIFNLESDERSSKWKYHLLPKKTVASSDGRWLAAMYHRKNEIRVWDMRRPASPYFMLKSKADTFLSFDFSKDGRFVYTTDWKKNIVVWDVLTREALMTLKGHTENINSVAGSDRILQFATGASGRTDSSILFWDLKSKVFPYAKEDEKIEFDPVWHQLGSGFSNKSLSATNTIINQRDRWIPLLLNKCKVDHLKVNSDVTELIDQLKDPKFKVRQWATEQLTKMANQVLPMLEEAKDSSSAEVRWRIKQILASRKNRPSTNTAETRRAHRCVLALELIGTPKAVDALEQFAAGHGNFNVSNEASEALKRLKK